MHAHTCAQLHTRVCGMKCQEQTEMAVAGELHTSCCAKGVDGGGGVFFQDTWSALPANHPNRSVPSSGGGHGRPREHPDSNELKASTSIWEYGVA